MTTPAHRVLRVPRATLVAAVAPEQLGPTLASLKAAGVISGYEERPREVVIWGDLLALESRLGFTTGPPASAPEPQDHRGEYYRLCCWFCTTPTFRRLPQLNQRIWKLHANGASFAEIGFRLRVTEKKVRVAIHGARLAANLPAVTSSMPRGGAAEPRPAAPRAQCKAADCQKAAEARGWCQAHYHQAKRIALRMVFDRPQVGKKTAG